MTGKLPKILFFCIALFLITTFAAGQESKPRPFSADFALTSPKNENLATGKLYLAFPRLRIDTKDTVNQVSAFIIIDYAKGVGMAVMPQFHTYTEIRLDQNQPANQAVLAGAYFDASNPCANHADWSCVSTGIDSIDGRKCDVWQITAGDFGQATVWVDQKLHFPIKSTLADGTSLEYSNIQEGQQPAPSLFQVPPGYQKVENKQRKGP